MRLRSQLILLAASTALICGGLGMGLIARSLKQSAETMLDGQLRIGQAALIRQLTLARAERQRAYEAIARQPYLRAYLAARESSQMGYYATVLVKAGADGAAVLDLSGKVLASDGPAASELVALGKIDKITRAGVLRPLGGNLSTVYRIAIGTEQPIGYLLLSNAFSATQLQADTRALGIEAAISVEGCLVSSLSERELAATDWRSPLWKKQLAALTAGYFVQEQPFEDGRLVLALSRSRVAALTTTFPTHLLGLVLLIVFSTSVVAMVVLSRVTGPIERLQIAVAELGNGTLVDSQNILRTFPKRQDEIGALAREFKAATRRIRTIVQQCQDLSAHLRASAETLDKTSARMASDAARQGQRLKELSSSFGPLTVALDKSSTEIGELTRVAVTAVRSIRHIEQEASSLAGLARRADERFAQLPAEAASGLPVDCLQKVTTLAKDSAALLKQISDFYSTVNKIAHSGNNVLNEQITEQHQGDFILRAIAEIDRLATAHTSQAADLMRTAEALRSELGSLDDALALFDTGALDRATLSQSGSSMMTLRPVVVRK